MLKQNKLTTIIAFLLLFLSLIGAFAPMNVFADDVCSVCYRTDHKENAHPCEICGAAHDLSDDAINSLQRRIYEMNNLVFAATMFESSNGSGLTTIDALVFDISSGEFQDLWNTARGFYDIFKILGIMLAVIYSLTETLAHLDKDKLTGEHFIREIFKMSIAAIFIMNGFDFVTGLVEIGEDLINAVGEAQLTSTFNSANCIYDSMLKNDNVFEAIINAFEAIIKILQLFLPWLALTIAKLVIAIACWARILELIVRVIFAPIGLSDMFVYGARSNGVKYMKKILVCTAQGAVTMGMVQAYGIIVASINPGEGQWFPALIMAIVLLASATKAKDIASDIMGV